ncbi:MAG: hypothetical protein LJE94_04625 [Deltaproteobacteria bacterium]|nr:hypothetical protein [Deltaproteobacteria bacterium]
MKGSTRFNLLPVFFSLLLCMSCSGGGGGGSTVTFNVVMGPIVDADFTITTLKDPDVVIRSGVTSDAAALTEAGSITIDAITEIADMPLLVRVTGGFDVDADDDGIRDETPTPNETALEFVLPSPVDLETLRVVANPLLLFATDAVFDAIANATNPMGDSNLPPGYDPAADPEGIRTVLRRVARAIIREDVNGDGQVDWQDLVTFHPLVDREKSRIPWEYVVSIIERRFQDYTARLDLHYATTTYLDRGTLEPYDWDGSGDWRDDVVQESDRSFVLQFTTNKNGYTAKDLYDEQGERGGRVVFPDDTRVTYFYGYPCEDQQVEGQETDVSEVPLDLRCNHSDDSDLTAQAGGNITDPVNAPVGDYLVEYATADGQTHQENIYVFENSEQSFHPVPEINVDEEGRIASFSIRFEDDDGNILEDPPILRGAVHFQLWADVGTVNSVLRGESYYSDPFGNPSSVDSYAYQANINIIDPTAAFYPESNGHLIYLEDLVSVNIWCDGGDGVTRGNPYALMATELEPQMSACSVEGELLNVTYAPSQETGREVLAVRYKFDNDSDWTEEGGDSLSIPIDSALKVWLSVKDTSGYFTRPEVFDLSPP